MANLVFDNWDKSAHELADEGRLVNIHSRKSIKKKKKALEIVEGSIYTPELGTTIETDTEVKEFSCKCGNLTGRFNMDEICPLCKSPVKETFSLNLETVGCINIAPYKVLTPMACAMVQSTIGETAFHRIINYDVKLDIDGNPVERVVNNSAPYDNIGLEEFYKRFEEIMLFYGRKNKCKKLLKAEFCIKNKKRFFTSNILVLPLDLRPIFTSNKKGGITYDPINKLYATIVTNAEIVLRNHKKPSKIAVLPNLYHIQKALLELFDRIKDQKISGKTRIIRNQILGCRTSYSSRMVIVSLTGKHFGFDHLVISYKAFLELYYSEILNCIRRGMGGPKFENMTSFEIVNYLDDSKYTHKVDEDIYRIMERMINEHEDGLYMLVNRNPTLDLGSIQLLKIVHVIKDANQCVMKIPLTSIAEPNADFDGDIFNNYKMLEKSMKEEFQKSFSPRALCLDSTGDGLFNDKFGIQKDAELAIHRMTSAKFTVEKIKDDTLKINL